MNKIIIPVIASILILGSLGLTQDVFAQGTTTNVGLHVTRNFQIDGNIIAFGVSEFRQGNTDLNGDGDTNDHILHVFNTSTGTTTNVGLAFVSDFAEFKIDGNLIAFIVSESNQGNTDLNGDGDTNDRVLHVFDASTGTTTNLGLASLGFSDFQIDGNLIAFIVPESNQGNTDLNGDGDTIGDRVLHVFNAATGTTTNVGIAGGGPKIDGNLIGFLAVEGWQGNTDFNGDGDIGDSVLHVFNAFTGTTTNVGLAFNQFGDLQIDGNLIAFFAVEFNQGNTDLNGDGDTNDRVLHVFDASTGTTTNVGLAPRSNSAILFQIDGNIVAFSVSESAQGNTDLNGDGDAGDFVLHVFNTSTGTTTNVGLAFVSGFGEFQIDGNIIALIVSESNQGNTDFNGDGDAGDRVLHVFDASTSTTTNVGLAIFRDFGEFQIDGNLIAFIVLERNQGFTDLNGDGDAGDRVLHIFDTSTGITTNVGLASDSFFQINGNIVAFSVPESAQGNTDFNGDGDSTDPGFGSLRSDLVLHIFDTSTGTTTNVGIDATNPKIDGNIVAFNVSELNQGNTDLNGDGDAFDGVLHVYEIVPPVVISVNLNDNLNVGPGDIVIVDGATVNGNIVVDGGTLIVKKGATVTGNIETSNGASLTVDNANINGNIIANANPATITNSDVNGNLEVINSQDVTVTGNTINGNLTIDGTTGSCTESSNSVNGNTDGCP